MNLDIGPALVALAPLSVEDCHRAADLETEGVVWTLFGVAVEDGTIADGCTYGDVDSPLARNLCDRTVTKDVTPTLVPFCQVEPCLIKEDVLVWVSQLKDPVQKLTITVLY